MTPAVRVCLWAVAICLMLDVTVARTNCRVGSGCTCNYKTVNVNRPNQTPRNFRVCCPPIPGDTCSQYVSAGDATATRSAYCNCDILRVEGNCLRGAECEGVNGTVRLNDMPVCCSAPNEVLTKFQINRATNKYQCQCSDPTIGWTGNCWKGNQCGSCDKDYTGSVGPLKLCCSNCQKFGLRINLGDKTCDCNTP